MYTNLFGFMKKSNCCGGINDERCLWRYSILLWIIDDASGVSTPDQKKQPGEAMRDRPSIDSPSRNRLWFPDRLWDPQRFLVADTARFGGICLHNSSLLSMVKISKK